MAQSLDFFLPNVTTQDIKKRLQCHEQLVPYLQSPSSSLYCEEMDKFMDGLGSWISSSNFKITLAGLEVVSLLMDRMGDHFRNHVTSVLPAVIDRLGDSKTQVRESARDVLVSLCVPASPQYVFERSMGAFTHKLWRVREEICICLQRVLNEHGAKGLGLNKLVPSIVKLLDDQSGPVRETAIETLVEVYRHVGEKVRSDLGKKDIQKGKLQIIFAKMDEVRNSGTMLAVEATKSKDETDFARPMGVPKTAKRVASAPSSAAAGRKSLGAKAPSAGSGGAGALDEDFFIAEFENVKKVHIYSGKELSESMAKIKDSLSDQNHDAWEKRAESCKEMRGLMIAGAADYDEFFQLLRTLEPPVILAVKDLRSQVVREACITIAYYSQLLGNKFDHFAEAVLPAVINLLTNSAKIMSTSGSSCLRFILKNTFGPRLIPIVTGNMSSKSNVIRRETCEYLDLILRTWPTQPMERHIAIIQEAIKKGINDADSEARALARKAFWGFSDHFKDQADSLLNSLEVSKQKQLQGELSNSSSNNSINSTGASRHASASAASASKSRARSMSTERGTNLYSRTLTSAPPRRTSVQTSKTVDSTDGTSLKAKTTGGNIQRSSSAVDLAGEPPPHSTHSKTSATGVSSAAQSNYNSLPRPRKPSGGSTASNVLSPERSRPRSKIGVSQSQPSSRSGSPSSRLSYITHQPAAAATSSRTPRRKSGIPRSQGASRETSPNRLQYGRERKYSGSGPRMMTAQRLPTKGRVSHVSSGAILNEHTLPQGSDIEQAVADALLTRGALRKRFDNYESDDAGSETSSVCSERSFSSYGRTSEDVSEILSNLSSGSWADRKEGLVSLQNILRGQRLLNRIELKKLTEIFTRMFHDPHGKVFSMFLETLIELLAVHRSDLHDWLYICLTRLLNKMGADVLGSLQAKIQRALEAVRDSFPYDHQFNILTRFIIDQTQTPNLKVKVALLNYLHGLAMLMDPADFANSSDTRLAVSRIITWTTEPKSVDVRKSAQAALIALFNLNSPEFSMMLSVLPKTFQDGATKILHNHLRSSSTDAEPLSPRNVTSPTTGPGHRFRPAPNRSNVEDVDTENMNPEDIYNSIKKTSADIQNLSKLDGQYEENKKERDSTSQDSGIQGSTHDLRGPSPDNKDRRRQYNPTAYQDESSNMYNKAALAEAVFDVENELFNEAPWKTLLGIPNRKEFPVDQSDVIGEILNELSNHNTREDERKNAMLQLIKITREGTLDVWEEHFKTILLLLLETLGDNDGHIRALSLRVLREILRHQPTRFKDYAELTILKILEAHKDPMKEVTRAAEECAATVANAIPADQCVRVLNPIVQTAEFPVNLAAIKMQTKVIESATKEVLAKNLEDMIPGLLKGYDNTESSVRKASVFSLVAMYIVMGEDLRPFLSELNGSKMKLLNLYIKRALAQKDGGSIASSQSTSKTTSPSSSTLTDLGGP